MERPPFRDGWNPCRFGESGRGGHGKDIRLGGGVSTVQQYLRARLIAEILQLEIRLTPFESRDFAVPGSRAEIHDHDVVHLVFNYTERRCRAFTKLC